MGIFNLNQHDSNQADQAESNAVSSQIENNDGKTGAVSGVGVDTGITDGGKTDAITPETAGDVNALGNVNNPGQGQGETKEGKVIVLDGPLSQIYTQALNMIYAQEEVGTMFSTFEGGKFIDKLKEDNDQALGAVNEDGVYVYAVDSSKLDGEGLVMASEQIFQATKTFKNVVLALENNGGNLARAQLLDQYSSSLGAKVYYSRDKALRSAVKGK